MKKILILGGTHFVGRALTETLLQQTSEEYEVALFNRGKSHPHLFPQLRKIQGDRETDALYQTCNEDWDAVLDISGYFPDTIQAYAERIKHHCGRYIFVSTASVYNLQNSENKRITEDFELLTCSKAERTDKTMATYGQRKVACEQALLQCNGLDAVIFRPSVVYGKYDPFDRHYYWLYRAKHNARILLPASAKTSFDAFTYVNDLAQALIAAIHAPTHRQVYNASTHAPTSLWEMVKAMADALHTHPEWVEVPAHFLDHQKVQVWTDIPLWMNGSFLMMDNTRLTADFPLQLTPLKESFEQTALYYEQLNWYLPKTGISLHEEEDVIELWEEKISE